LALDNFQYCFIPQKISQSRNLKIRIERNLRKKKIIFGQFLKWNKKWSNGILKMSPSALNCLRRDVIGVGPAWLDVGKA